jgi:hypothetical protein
MVLRATAIWLALLGIAIVNGAVRSAWISPRLGEYAGHVLSTIVLCAVIAWLALVSIRWVAPAGLREAFLVGVLWVVLTVVFEFIGGHYLFGNPWPKLLADYDILHGRLWLLVLVTNLLAPLWAARIKTR